ncbi:flagellin, partial [bacterium]|nr:flagellin [bacterium]
MAVVINTNVDSIKIQGLVTNSTNKLSESMQRMSSGMKILSAKDDAAGTVISAKMQVQLNGNQIAQKN